MNDRDSSSNQILFSLIRYVTETIRSVSVLFSDSENEPADPNIIYEEPDDASDKDVSDAARTTLLYCFFWGGKREMLSISQKQMPPPPHAPTVRSPRNRKGGPGVRASWVGV